MDKVNLAEKFAAFDERWSPRIVGTVDDYEFKIVKIEGDFVWHKHDAADELFYVVEGALRMDFRDCAADVKGSEMIVVPYGIEHKPFAAEECRVMLHERTGLVNTGDAGPGPLTNQAKPI